MPFVGHETRADHQRGTELLSERKRPIVKVKEENPKRRWAPGRCSGW